MEENFNILASKESRHKLEFGPLLFGKISVATSTRISNANQNTVCPGPKDSHSYQRHLTITRLNKGMSRRHLDINNNSVVV